MTKTFTKVKDNQGKFYKIVYIGASTCTRGLKIVSYERPDEQIVWDFTFGDMDPETGRIVKVIHHFI